MGKKKDKKITVKAPVITPELLNATGQSYSSLLGSKIPPRRQQQVLPDSTLKECFRNIHGIAPAISDSEELKYISNKILDTFTQLRTIDGIERYLKYLLPTVFGFIQETRTNRMCGDRAYCEAIVYDLMQHYVTDKDVENIYERAVAQIGYKQLNQPELMHFSDSEIFPIIGKFYDRSEEVIFVFNTFNALLYANEPLTAKLENIARQKAELFYKDKMSDKDRDETKAYILDVLSIILGVAINKALFDKNSEYKNMLIPDETGVEAANSFLMEINHILSYYVETGLGDEVHKYSKFTLEAVKSIKVKLKGIEIPTNYNPALFSLCLHDDRFVMLIKPITYIIPAISYTGGNELIDRAKDELFGIMMYYPYEGREYLKESSIAKPKFDRMYFDRVIEELKSDEPIFISNDKVLDMPARMNSGLCELFSVFGVEQLKDWACETVLDNLEKTHIWMPDDYIRFNYALCYVLGAYSQSSFKFLSEQNLLDKFKDNAEKTPATPSKIQKSEQEKYREQITKLESELAKTKKLHEKEIYELNNKIKKLNNEIEGFSEERDELKILREIIWNDDNTPDEEELENVVLDKFPYDIGKKKIAMYGGFKTLEENLPRYIPGITYYGADKALTKDMLRGYDLVIVVTSYIPHSRFHKVVDYMKNNETPFFFTSKNGLKSIANEVVKHLENLK